VVAADERRLFTPDQIEFFESHVRPVLVEHCYECHSTDSPELMAGLYVDSHEGILKGGDSGPAVVAGNPQESLLILSVKYESNEMPPDRKLNQRQIEALARWVEMGAPWPQVTSSPGVPLASAENKWAEFDWVAARAGHWAWQPVRRPDIPPVDGAVENPIDNFVITRRSEAQLRAAPRAAPRILARRIYTDLVGILPTPEQLQAFVANAKTNPRRAVELLVDQLLESPMYGQRWGRHWLDVARYSDGHGGFLDNQALDGAWRYRDWVVDALNDDLPINEFMRLQIAGDMSGQTPGAIATGFFALGPTYRSDGGDPDSIAQAKGETLDDRIDTLTRGLLGITGSCARCHDHKFDPIPQKDYYSLAGVFNNSATHPLPLAADEVVKRYNEFKKAEGDLNENIKKIQQKIKKEASDASASDQQQLEELKMELAELKRNAPPGFETAHVLRETGSADMAVALRGNLRKTGEIAPRRFLRVLSDKEEPTRFTSGSGREELAAAIVDPQNPLTARVFVNRVWMHHFGAGLVRTPSNFGTLGEQPTHPQLLDWLADEFVSSGWSLKSLHRLIMTSATYQLGSDFDENSFQADGDNRLLWRVSPRRMDVEAWRDSLLAVTGELDPSLGGPPLVDITKNKRRTLYAKVSRNGDAFPSDAFLRRFDFPMMRATVAQRPQSIVPQQYLFLLNSSFMVQRAQSLVDRLQGAAESNEERIKTAYQLLYNRSPGPSELQIGMEFVEGDQANDDGVDSEADSQRLSSWTRYAQVLLSSNEFMFVR
jgi:hypothetical protein